MKLISWNVNGIRACVKKGFLDFFNLVDADIFCIQESKLQEGQIDLNLEGYYTKEEIDAKLENLDLSEYYTKTEIDDKFTAIDNILNNVLYEY